MKDTILKAMIEWLEQQNQSGHAVYADTDDPEGALIDGYLNLVELSEVIETAIATAKT